MKRRSRSIAYLVVLVLLPISRLAAQANGLAKTPPMGWSSWNVFACQVSDSDIRAAADAVASNGMRDARYTFINIDDCWEGKRNSQGNIQSNERFPDMKALAEYVHTKGLKIGIYSSPGPQTCGGFEGSFEHEQQDAKTYAEWGFDYLKYDMCSARNMFQSAEWPGDYKKMGDALLKTGRPIVYSLSHGDNQRVWSWAPWAGANLSRIGGDIRPNPLNVEHLAFLGGGWSALQVRGTGTIQTCSRWATKNSQLTRTANTSGYGVCWPRH